MVLGRSAALAAAVVVVLAFAASALGARGTGTLELCKAADNGAAGAAFGFTATSGTKTLTATVEGGTCTDLAASAGKWTVVEDLGSGLWAMAGATVVPPGAWVSENARAGRVRVVVTAGQDTQVTVTNQPAGATIKVCKWSSTPALQGKQFAFTIGTRSVTATAGATSGTAGCSSAVATQPAARVKIVEAVPASERVAGVTTSANTVLTSSSGGVVRVVAGTGANVVTFQNEPQGPPQTGYLEICKDAGDAYISTTEAFTFTVADGAGATDTEHVAAGQCSGPIAVAAGNVTVGEEPTPGTSVTAVSTFPDAGALGATNLANRTAVVVVPVSAAPAGEVQVHFVNSTQTATLKVCKVLTQSSGALAGTRFDFEIFSRSVTDVDGLSIVASANANGACKVFGVRLPVGSTATVVEDGVPSVSANGGLPGEGDSRTVTIQPGVNTVMFTNQAYGQLEICKQMQQRPTDDTPWDGTVFHFSVDGAKESIDVAAGACSLPLLVPAGSHTVREVDIPYGFAFVSSVAVGPLGESRATGASAGNGGNPVTVTVPFFDGMPGGETQVTFTNRVLRANLKICKLVSPGSEAALGSTTFSFFYVAIFATGGFADAVDVRAGACSGLISGDATGGGPGIPVVNPDGTRTEIFLGEGFTGGYHVSGIAVNNGDVPPGDPNPDVVCGSVFVEPDPGTVIVTFTNTAGDVDMTRCFS